MLNKVWTVSYMPLKVYQFLLIHIENVIGDWSCLRQKRIWEGFRGRSLCCHSRLASGDQSVQKWKAFGGFVIGKLSPPNLFNTIGGLCMRETHVRFSGGVRYSRGRPRGGKFSWVLPGPCLTVASVIHPDVSWALLLQAHIYFMALFNNS